MLAEGGAGAASSAKSLRAEPAIAGTNYARAATVRTWRLGGRVHVPRSSHAAAPLPDGTVLVCGGNVAGEGSFAGRTNSVEICDFDRRSAVSTAAMSASRAAHQAVSLRDGTVLVPDKEASELYDPATGRWRASGGLRWRRVEYTATALATDRVLVTGGLDETSGVPIVAAEMYSPSTGQWSSAGRMRLGRMGHASVPLPDGRVLVTGGVTLAGFEIETASGAEIYDPTSGRWQLAGHMAYPRFSHTATVLSDGTVLVAGGCELGHNVDERLPSEIYDPLTGTWSSGPPLLEARAEHTATRLGDGRVLVAGGRTSHADATATAELYDPLTGCWVPAPPLHVARRLHTATVLECGAVVVAGGETVEGGCDDCDSQYVARVEVLESIPRPERDPDDPGEVATSFATNGMGWSGREDKNK